MIVLLIMALTFTTTIGMESNDTADLFPRVVDSVPDVRSDVAGSAGYDATESHGKRRLPMVDHRSEDRILDTGKRAVLQANSYDLQRNYALCAWAIRTHLNYVTTFGFQSQTSDEGFNKELEARVAEHDQRIDVTGRHSYQKLTRLLEGAALVMGDCGLLMIDEGDGLVQGIESDRIRTAYGDFDFTPGSTHGVVTDERGRATGYQVHKRTPMGLQYEREIPAQWMLMHGYYDRFDQIRGISPLSSGLNPLRDTYENSQYALAKMKLSQILGFKVTRNGTTAFTDTEAEEAVDGNGNPIQKYKADFGSGPAFFDMDPGEDADFFNVATPPTEFRQFMDAMIQLTLKCLDISYSFYDESHTNFFGSVGAINHYKRSTQHKIEALQRVLNREKQWRFSLWIRDRKLTLPKGVSLDRPFWKHVPLGMPWWKPTEEIAGVGAAIGMGLDSPQQAAEAHGTNFHDNIDQTAAACAYAQEKLAPYGMSLSFNPQMPVTQIIQSDSGKPNGKEQRKSDA